jgi:hypothetical protein
VLWVPEYSAPVKFLFAYRVRLDYVGSPDEQHPVPCQLTTRKWVRVKPECVCVRVCLSRPASNSNDVRSLFEAIRCADYCRCDGQIGGREWPWRDRPISGADTNACVCACARVRARARYRHFIHHPSGMLSACRRTAHVPIVSSIRIRIIVPTAHAEWEHVWLVSLPHRWQHR